MATIWREKETLTKFDNVCLDVSVTILKEIHEHASLVFSLG